MKKACDNCIELSYISHTKNLENLISIKDSRLKHVINTESISYQLYLKVLRFLNPFIHFKSSWLTIGDYNGLEANYLMKHGQNAVPSDITDIFLKEVHDEGLIDNYLKINVEKIELADNSFDYVFCKETFHHFPRAFLGLYEMIRVAKNAAIIIEPIDILSKLPLLLLVKNILDRFDIGLINKIWKNRFSFEIVGNYVFKISEREVEKMAMGIGLPCIAFKAVNIMKPNYSIDKLLEVPINKTIWRKVTFRKAIFDTLSYLKIIPANHLICIIFSKAPAENVRKEMKIMGYKIIDLPKNPFFTKT